MRNALINYSKKVLELKQFWMPKEFDEIEPEMAEEMKRNFLIPRTTKTDFTPFKEKFGFDVPREIKDYFDLSSGGRLGSGRSSCVVAVFCVGFSVCTRSSPSSDFSSKYCQR